MPRGQTFHKGVASIRLRCYKHGYLDERVPKDLSPNGSSECCLLAQNRHGLSKFAISPFPPSPSPRSSPHNKRRELLPAAPCDRFQTKSLRGGGSPRCVIPAADRRAWCRVRACAQNRGNRLQSIRRSAARALGDVIVNGEEIRFGGRAEDDRVGHRAERLGRLAGCCRRGAETFSAGWARASRLL